MASFGNLFASLTLESASFMSGVKAAQKELRETQKTFAKVGGQMQKIGAGMTVAVTTPLLGIAAAAVNGAKAQQQAMAQVNAALASMGPVAGKTADELSKAADKMEMNSLFDADVILTKVTANLLTFGNIAGTVFDRAQQSAIDMAARLGQDPQAAAVMLGKALNDPAKGLTALTRVGVSFTAQQQEQIKAMAAAGNIAGAQGLILDELSKQYGGAAKAAADTTPWRQAEVAIAQAGDTIGEALLPIIPPIANAVRDMALAFGSLSPRMQQIVIIGGATAAAIGPIAIGLGSVIKVVGVMLPAIMKLGVVWNTLKLAFVAVRVAALSTLPALIPFLAPLAAIAGAVALVYAAYKHWDKIKPIIDRAVGWVKGLYEGVRLWLFEKLGGIVRGVTNTVAAMVKPFKDAYVAVVGNSYIPDMVNEIGQHMRRLDQEMVKPAKDATKSAADAFRELQQQVQPILDRLFPQQARDNVLVKELEALDAAARKGIISMDALAEARARAMREYGKDVESAPDPIAEMLGSGDVGVMTGDIESSSEIIISEWEKVQAANDNVKASFADMARDVTASVRGLVDNLKSGDILGAIESVLDLIGQVTSIVKGVNAPAQRTYGLNGARAKGGPVMPRGNYLVGERGPEILRMGGRGGSIVPNNQIGGGGIAQIVPSPYFDVVVDGRVVNTAGPMIGSAAYGARRGEALRSRQRLA